MSLKFVQSITLIILLTSILFVSSANLVRAKFFKVVVVAPLEPTYQLNGWDVFKQQLQRLKEIGVYAIETDVWWNEFQPSENTWNWTYYREYAKNVNDSGLKWIPIISLHWVPNWVWQEYPDSKFVNDYNQTSDMYLSYWHPASQSLITNATDAFFETFEDYNDTISGVYISMGMWGELQYPWMLNNSLANRTYYGYSRNAQLDFNRTMRSKYVTLDNANANWGTDYNCWCSMEPPLPNTTSIGMWNDFLWWYNSTLVKFEDHILSAARQKYRGAILAKISMDPNSTWDLMLGHSDYDAIFSVLAEYSVIPTCTYVENDLIASKFANISRSHNLNMWAENAEIGADLKGVSKNLETFGYDVYSYIRMTDLFEHGATTSEPTARYNELKNLTQGGSPFFPLLLVATLLVVAVVILVIVYKRKDLSSSEKKERA